MRALFVLLLAPLVVSGSACAPPHEEPPTVELRGYAPASAARLRAAGWRTGLERALVPLDAVRIGPVGRERFEPLLGARYARADEVELDAAEPVLVLRREGALRAWPLAHLARRELLQDELDGLPLAVTYCSLCASARAFDRRVDGAALELRVSGLLLDGNALLHDVGTESLWRQLDGRAVVGALAGAELRALPTFTLSFGALRAARPDALVMLAPEPGAEPPLARISAADVAEGEPPAWMSAVGRDPLTLLLEVGAARCAVAGEGATLFEDALVLRDGATGWPGQGARIALGSAAAFRRELDGRALEFEPWEGGARDLQTGSRWNLLGEAVEGPLAGRALEPCAQVQAFRFALEAGS